MTAGRRDGGILVALGTDFLTLCGPDAVRGWGDDVHVLDRPRLPWWRLLARLLREARRRDALILDGSVGLRGGYLDQLVTAVVTRIPGGPAVVISDCTWKRGTSRLDRTACQIGIRAIDGPRVRYCVATEDEVRTFPRTWGVPPGRVTAVGWPYILPDEMLAPGPEDGSVFGGGDSLRDHAVLIEAARGLPVPARIATRDPAVRSHPGIPPNVQVGPVSPDRYVEMLRRASVIVVPLLPTDDRSAGETTYVNAMAMGKLVVVSDCLGVRHFVTHGETGLVVPPGDAAALHRALAWAVDPANAGEVSRIRGAAARAARERFTPQGYVARLVEVARSALAAGDRARSSAPAGGQEP